VLRSPHAHARIASIDVARAEGVPGVLAVLTGSDAAEDGLQPIPHRPVPANPHEVPLKSRDGSPFFIAPPPVLAVGKVRHNPETGLIEVTRCVSIDDCPSGQPAAEPRRQGIGQALWEACVYDHGLASCCQAR
jgi:CO/xanthine dehydrogenase Mo-binding subunit